MCGIAEGCLLYLCNQRTPWNYTKMAVYGTYATKRPIGTIHEEKGISPRSCISICCDMKGAVEHDIQTIHPFFIIFNWIRHQLNTGISNRIIWFPFSLLTRETYLMNLFKKCMGKSIRQLIFWLSQYTSSILWTRSMTLPLKLNDWQVCDLVGTFTLDRMKHYFHNSGVIYPCLIEMKLISQNGTLHLKWLVILLVIRYVGTWIKNDNYPYKSVFPICVVSKGI